jgi:hypothetical protein
MAPSPAIMIQCVIVHADGNVGDASLTGIVHVTQDESAELIEIEFCPLSHEELAMTIEQMAIRPRLDQARRRAHRP